MGFKWLVLCLSIISAVTSYEFVLRPIYGSQNEGYIEMKVNGTWGVMTSGSVYIQAVDTTARKLCEHFGFGLRGFYTGSPTELKLTNNVLLWDKFIQCDGTESSVSECVHGTWSNNGNWVTSLSKGWTRLHCYDFKVTDIRLDGGLVPHVGRLEVKVGSRWGGVYMHPHSPYGPLFNGYAKRLCPLLGYYEYRLPWSIYSSGIPDSLQPVTEMWRLDISCESGITNITACSVNRMFFPSSYGIIKILCEATSLLNGSTPNAGIVQAGMFGRRQMFCASSDFNVAAANVTCNLLGHQRVGRMSVVHLKADNVGDVFSGSIQCNGTEQSLEICEIVEKQDECEASSVVYIECFDDPMDIIPVGNKTNEGVVTFTYFDQVWLIKGTVSNTTAKTFCHLLGHGFEGTTQSIVDLPRHVFLPEYSYFSTIECNGNETEIAQCLKTVYIHPLFCRGCPDPPPIGVVVLYCAECPPGYFGTYCTECNCNNRSIGPCDVDTGECTCMTGWEGASCEVDIDECETTTTCPNISDCANVPGSYKCVCRPGYTLTNDVCSIIQNREETETQSHLLVIILSSVSGGLALIFVIAIFCMCKYRQKGKKDTPTTTVATHTNRSGNEHTLSGPNKPEDYSTIEDGSHGALSDNTNNESKTDPYDTLDYALTHTSNRQRNVNERPDLPGRHYLNQVNANEKDVTKDYDYTYPREIPTDKDGYLHVHDVGIISSVTNYQSLKPQNRTEHEYCEMKH